MLTERLLSVASIGTIVAVMTALNDEVSRHVSHFAAQPSRQLSMFAGWGLQLGRDFNETLHAYTGEHGLMFIFALFAIILAGAMFKS